MRSLSKDSEIIIKPADKGGAIVIQNTKDYIAEANRQLNDTNTYLKLDSDPTQTYEAEIDECLENMVRTGEITKQVKKGPRHRQTENPKHLFPPKNTQKPETSRQTNSLSK